LDALWTRAEAVAMTELVLVIRGPAAGARASLALGGGGDVTTCVRVPTAAFPVHIAGFRKLLRDVTDCAGSALCRRSECNRRCRRRWLIATGEVCLWLTCGLVGP
jgi:hypothetical protein